ncbi:hypothetical protein ES703_110055 [subsurface metagenome]
MKSFLKKKWHRLPVGIITLILLVCLVAGSAFAAYDFFISPLQVEVEEAIVLGVWNPTDPDHSGWDNLEPYGSVDDVEIVLGGTESNPEFSITTIPGYAGAGLVAGEYIVIPINFRNAGDGELPLGASVDVDGFLVECIWQTNTGPETSVESGQSMCRGFKATGTWASLDGWTGTIAGNGGKPGSAVVGAKVLFVKISAPADIAPGGHTITVTFSRG